MKRDVFLIVVMALLLRLPFLNHPIQGDDLYYLYGAQHAQVEPLHPMHTHYAFQGEVVDVEGHPHGPLNFWILGGLLALVGDIREVPFHAAYALFSIVAALAMYSLARKFTDKPLIATLLFMSVPAFVVNGNSFETDLPFLALWLSATALWVRAIDKQSVALLIASAFIMGCAALQAYQSVLLVPILAVYLWQDYSRNGRAWTDGFSKAAALALLMVPTTIVLWQAFEWSTTGTLPLKMMLSYMSRATQQSASNKLGSAVALIGHAGWVMPPLLIALAFVRSANRWRLGVAASAALGAAFHDVNPLFWMSVGLGVLLLLSTVGTDFLGMWIAIFVAGSILIFYAGAARYLLPMAAPAAILLSRALSTRILLLGFVLQLPVSIGLAAENSQHWVAVRNFSREIAQQAKSQNRRIWVNGEMALRFYLEAEGARALLLDQEVRAGDMVVTSELVGPVVLNVPTARVATKEVIPSVPLRIISIEGGSGYSTSGKGLLPFEISREVVDELHADVVAERTVEFSYVDPKDPKAKSQLISGIFTDGWMLQQASVILKVPENASKLEASVYLAANANARRVELLADGAVIGEAAMSHDGVYTVSAPYKTSSKTTTVGLRVDATFSVPTDGRKLGVIVTGVGFR